MSGKFALVIGNSEYQDARLAQLTAPGRDAEDLARILSDKDFCAFDDVRILLNQPQPVARKAINEFFKLKNPDDLLLLYFSGHGVRDEQGALYLAVKDTDREFLDSTAIESLFIHKMMEQSRSKRQVLILDCCNSGAFQQGTKADTGGSLGTATAFGGYGRIILTASDALQYAWQGDAVIGSVQNSLFTHFLVEGLKGEADLDGDGVITVDELYDYAYEQVRRATPNQTPSKFSSKQEGEIVLRQITRLDQIKAMPLPDPLVDSMENAIAGVRLGAVQELARLLKGKNLALARSAREALEKLSAEDDGFSVRKAASDALAPIHAAEELAKKQEEEQLAAQKAEEQRVALEKAAAERAAQRKAERERRRREKAESEKVRRQEAGQQGPTEVKVQQERAAHLRREQARPERQKREKAETTATPVVAKAGTLSQLKPRRLSRTTLLYGGGAAMFSIVVIVGLFALSRYNHSQQAMVQATSTAKAAASYAQLAMSRDNKVYGPVNNKLEHNTSDKLVKIAWSGVSANNFAVRARFSNPYPTSIGPWDYGFRFGEFLYLVVTSGQKWTLEARGASSKDNAVIAWGDLPNLDVSDNEINDILLICEDNKAKLYVRGEFISDIDLSGHNTSGQVALVTGVYLRDQVDGYSTPYQDFTVWRLP